jgi:hypothetical protein
VQTRRTGTTAPAPLPRLLAAVPVQLYSYTGQLHAAADKLNLTSLQDIHLGSVDLIQNTEFYGPLVKTLASRGICTMNVAARRTGWKIRQTSNCRAITLQDAFQLFVEPLGISKWDDTFYHDSRYDVHKTLELYDALYCHKS